MPSARRAATERDDLHARLAAWVTRGGTEDPPRDVALHGSVCAECGIRLAAFDGLAAIDPGRAPLPPSRPVAERALVPLGRLATIAAVMVLAGALTGIAIGALPDGGAPPVGEAQPTQAVLGGTGAPASHGPDASGFGGGVLAGSPTPTATSSGSPAIREPAITPGPTFRPSTPASAQPTLRQSPSATAGSSLTPAASPTASPTSVPTAIPTPEPTPEPTATPTPAPDDCANGVDDDGDGLIDFGDGVNLADPGCLLDGNEPSA